MPSIVGAFKVLTNSGTLNNGDSFIIAPTTSSKSYSGSGSGVNGDFPLTINLFSAVLTNDPDVVDDSTTKVATGS